jgi:hypothetical protein
LKTSEAIAAELDTSPATVKRSGKRAEVYDAMLELDDVESQAALAASVDKAIERGEISKRHGGGYQVDTQVVNGAEVDRWRKLAAIPAKEPQNCGPFTRRFPLRHRRLSRGGGK